MVDSLIKKISGESRKGSMEEHVFGSKETTQKFTNFLLAQSSILHKLLSEDLKNERIKTLKIVVGSICQTATAIAILAEKDLSNESTMLARGFIEKVINFMYVVIADEEEYKNYLMYSKQKAFRKLDREVVVGKYKIGTKFGGLDEFEISDDLQDSLNLFTGKKGGEKTRWTKKTIEERLASVEERSSIKAPLLMLMILDVYENASEALHGTFYGCAFHTGYYLPEFRRGQKKMAERREQKNISLLVVNIGSAISQVISFIEEKEGNPTSIAANLSKQNVDTVAELMGKVVK